MPSPCRGTGFYKRKGGAYKKSRKGHAYKHVGYGKGTHSLRSPTQDRARRARKGTPKQKRRYSQHYD